MPGYKLPTLGRNTGYRLPGARTRMPSVGNLSEQVSPEMLAQLLAQQKPPGLLSQMGSNAWNELTAFKYLPAAAVMLPGMVKKEGLKKTAHDVLYEPLKEYYKSYKHPLEHIKQYPLGTLMDAATVASLGSGLLLKGAARLGASAETLGTIGKLGRTAQTIGKLGTPAEWVKYPMELARKSYIGQAAKSIPLEEMSRIGKIGQKMQALEGWKLGTKEMARTRLFGTTKATKAAGDIGAQMDKLYAKLSPEERLVFHDYMTNSLTTLEKKSPETIRIFQSNPNMKKLWEAQKSIGENLAEDFKANLRRDNPNITDAELEKAVKAGIHRPQALREVSMDLLKEKRGLDDRVASMLEKGDKAGLSAMNKYYEKLIEDMWPARQKLIYQESAANKKGFEERISKKLEEIGKHNTSNMLYGYSGHINQPWEEYVGRVAERGKPGFRMRKMSLAPEIHLPEQMKLVAVMHTMANERVAGMERVIGRGLKSGVVKPYDYMSPIGHEEMIVAPTLARRNINNTLRTIDSIPVDRWADAISGDKNLGKELIGLIERYSDMPASKEMTRELEGVLGAELPPALREQIMSNKFALREYLKKSVPAYVVPRNLGNQLLNKGAEGANTFVRMFFDAPNQLWRSAVLTMSPRWLLYNTAGNILFTMLHGTNPKSFYHAATGKFDEYMPPDIAAGLYGTEGAGMTRTTRGAFDFLKGPMPSKVLESELTGPHKMMLPTQPGMVGKTLEKTGKALTFLGPLNQKIENFFRKAVFIDEAQRAVMKERMQQGAAIMAKQSDAVEKRMVEFMKDPVKAAEMADEMGKFMFNYNNLSSFEKNFMRRVMPFYSWTRNMFRFTFWTLPAEHPVKFRLLNMLAEVGKQTWQQTLADKGIDLNLVPDWFKGSIPIDYDPKTKEITWWSTIGVNPLTTITEMDMRQILSSLDPKIKIAIERAIKEDLFKGQKFESTSVFKDPMGGLWEQDPNRPGHMKRSEGKAPPLTEHILRQFPQYQLLKQWLMNRKYGDVPTREFAESTALNLQPIMGKNLKPAFTVPFRLKAPAILGMPMTKSRLTSPTESKMEKAAIKKQFKQIKQGNTP